MGTAIATLLIAPLLRPYLAWATGASLIVPPSQEAASGPFALHHGV
jgi:hypothetical protein